MRRILEVARREFLETVKTRTFLLGLLMTPLLMGAILYFGERAARLRPAARAPKHVALSDLWGTLREEVRSQFDAYNASHANRQVLLEEVPAEAGTLASVAAGQKDRVGQGRLDAYVVVEGNVAGGEGKFVLYTGQARAADLDFPATIEGLLHRAASSARCRARGLSPDLVAELTRSVPLEQVEVGAAGGQDRLRGRADQMTALMVPFFFMFLMFMGVFGTGQHILTSLIEEKASRVMEVLLSAVSPLELMAGKILGLGAIGLTMMGLWCGAAVATARWRGLSLNLAPEMFVYFAVYYALGFLLFSSFLAAVGSVCNTIKECQSLMMPLSLLCVVPMMAWFYLAQNPEGTLATALSFIPPLTPMVMVLRLSASPRLPPIEIAATMALLAASVPAAMWAAAKIFRTGVLLYGKRPGFSEILRWVWQS